VHRYDLVVGSWFKIGLMVACVNLELLSSRLFNLLFMTIFRSGVLNNTNSFRMYRRWILARISSSRLRFQRFPYLLEVMIRARRHGAKVAEVPTEYEYRRSSSNEAVYTRHMRNLGFNVIEAVSAVC